MEPVTLKLKRVLDEEIVTDVVSIKVTYKYTNNYCGAARTMYSVELDIIHDSTIITIYKSGIISITDLDGKEIDKSLLKINIPSHCKDKIKDSSSFEKKIMDLFE